MLRKPDGGSRGFGFVTYEDEISVEKCLVMQHQLNGRTVELKRAIRKEDMGPPSAGGGYGAPAYGAAPGYGGVLLIISPMASHPGQMLSHSHATSAQCLELMLLTHVDSKAIA